MCIWNGPNRLFMKRERVCAYLCETLSVFCMCSGIFRSRGRCQCERGTPLLRPSRMWHVICGRNLPIMSAVGSQSSFLLRGSNKEAVTKGWGEGRGRGEGEGGGEAIGSTFLLIGLEAVGLPTHHFMLKRHQRKKGKTSIWAATCGFYIILLWPSSAITF